MRLSLTGAPLLALLLAACGGGEPPSERQPEPPAADETLSATAAARTEVEANTLLPRGAESCAGCHPDVVASYTADHGMARSVQPVGAVVAGRVEHPDLARSYTVEASADGGWLTTSESDGGMRRQKIVGRIGAGNFGNSWVTAEADVVDGSLTDRLYFAPLETMGGELVLAPFEESEPAAGADLALTEGCLTCHVDQPLVELPDAHRGSQPGGHHLYPANALGAEAFDHLRGIGCEACHGSTELHLAVVAGDEIALDQGLDDLAALPARVQLDVCARCHLQGDFRWELTGPANGPHRAASLAARLPTLVAGDPGDDFRFVGQHERLELSACFTASPAMTCSTCHEAHRGVAAQGTASFDARCQSCHEAEGCSRPADLEVEAVTGEPGRSAAGCVDCHVRRSQPFDLTHVRSADHWIRRRTPPPEQGIPHRQFQDRDGVLELWGRSSIAEALATPAGATWEAAVRAMGLATLGRFDEAAEWFGRLPAPGSEAAVTPTASSPLTPLLSRADLHETRALVLMARGEIDAALAALGDALALDPSRPSARLARARLRLDRGDIAGTLEDSQMVIEMFPSAEQPWRLRVDLAERTGRVDLAQAGLEALTRRWPSDGVAWHKLALLLEQTGRSDEAAHASERALRLAPEVDLRR